MTDATPCAGGPSNTRHAALARVCGLCEHYSRTASERLPGFSGSTCTSFQRRTDDAALRGGSSNT